MKHTIGIITLLVMLLMGVTVEAWALSATDIKIDILPAEAKTAGCTVIVNPIGSDGKTVTITATPTSEYYVTKENVVAYLLVSPSSAAPRRAVPISDPLVITGDDGIKTGATDYSFVVPEGYAGAQVTVTFTKKGEVTANVKANNLIYNQTAQALVTTTVEGGTVLYQVDATDANGFTEGIPTKTAVKRTENEVTAYKVYYKIVPDAGFSAPAFDATKDFVEVKINPAKLTKVTLDKVYKTVTDPVSELTFSVVKLHTANMTDDSPVENTDYTITGNKQSVVNTYTATITGIGNYEGTVTAKFEIVASSVVLVDSNTPKDKLVDPNGTYILTSNITISDAAYFAGLSPFTGTFDGGMYTISGLTKPLFTTVDGATIRNVVLDNVNLSHKSDNLIATNDNLGAICNEASGTTKIYNCGILKGSVGGGAIVGGLVGLIKESSKVRVVNCYNYANVSASSYAAGIVGKNEGAVASDKSVGDVRIALCMMYGSVSGAEHISPVYGGNHVNNVQNFTEYNYYLYSNERDEDGKRIEKIPYTTYNDQMAIDKDIYLTRFPFYCHVLNTHRKLAAFFLFGATTQKNVSAISEADINEIGHWVLKRNEDDPKYPVVEKWESNTRKVLDAPAKNVLTDRGINGYLSVSAKIDGTTYTANLPITDMDEAEHDYTYGKVILPFANEFVKNTDYTRICTGWKITNVTGGNGAAFENYNFSDRNCTTKDLYETTGFIFAQGGNYIVPYGVTAISIEANFATAYYLSDAGYDVGLKTDYGGATKLGGDMSFSGGTVYNSLKTVLGQMPAKKNPHEQAVVLVGNFHFNEGALANDKAFTLMSIDEDCNQEPDYGFYCYNTVDRPAIPPVRFDFLPMFPLGMMAHVAGSQYNLGFPIWKPRGWFELTETALCLFNQFELDSGNFTNSDDNTNNYRCIINGGYFVQMVRGRNNNCSKVKYIQIGGNAYIKEFYPGNHSAKSNNVPLVPINVTGGEVEQCFMTGYGKGKAIGANIYFWCAGGYIHKFLGAYMEQPKQTTSAVGNVNMTAKIDHAKIDRFFGGGTSANATISGNIDVTINNSMVKFYCGGPEFGNMTSGKTVITRATNTTFDEFYGAGFGGTSITYVNYEDASINISSNATTDYPDYFTNHYLSTSTTKLEGRLKLVDGGIGTCYKFEYIPHSVGKQVVARYFTGYAQFSLATTGSVTNVLNGCTIKGDFYGAGCQGKVNGSVTSTLTGCTVEGSAFGGGFKAAANDVEVYTTTKPDLSKYYKEKCIFSEFGKIDPVIFEWKYKDNEHAAGTSVDADNNGKGGKLYTDVVLTDLGNVTNSISLIIDGGSVSGNVFGGGNESKSLENTNVSIINGAEIGTDVYGGGNKANVDGDTKVILLGGTIEGDAYGGGRGQLASAAVGTEDEEGYKPAVTAVAATVGATTVYLNGMEKADYTDEKYGSLGLIRASESENAPYIVGGSKSGCIVNGRIFGCNNLNGSPLDNATVHIYKTAGASRTRKEDLDNIDDSKHHYHIQAVYGGGNLAAYIPDAADATTHVIIDGCDMTSIRQVYGGGNAASTPATKVEVNGTYEIEELFGGGNGKDPIGEGKPNPGANVGYYDYSKRDDNGIVVVDDNGLVQEKNDAMTVAQRQQNYQYGTGEANVKIYGGLVHRVFGGSNTLGNVRKTALTLLDGQEDCEFKVDEAYGGGKSAPMDGAAHLEMACIPGLKAAYGGAEEANILNDVTLNITNGTFDRVFGGNNVQGTISGKITVNIEETGCRPIIIGQLYGGGNQAPYTASDGETGPTLNIRSFTSIGDVFGGGYGKTAVVTGNTTVDINVCEGKFFDKETQSDLGKTTIRFTEYERDDNGDFVLDGDNNRTSKTVNLDIYQPPHTAGQIGAINNVFGGGNAAKVIGNTNVNIGTKIGEQVNVVSLPIKDSANREPSDPNWEPTYTMKEVKGVNIVGNVYGGGNEAEVTGSTNVTIGKETTTTTTSTPAPPVTPEPAEQTTPANP